MSSKHFKINAFFQIISVFGGIHQAVGAIRKPNMKTQEQKSPDI